MNDINSRINDDDILWFKRQVTFQRRVGFIKICEMQLKLAEAIKQLQDESN